MPRSEDFARWLTPGLEAAATGAPGGLLSSVNWSYGGVHWYGRLPSGDYNVPLGFIDAKRPLNVYISGSRTVDVAAPTFECPLDNGSSDTITNSPNIWVNVGPPKDRRPGGARGTRMYDQLGTSYEANDWMYCLPGSWYGIWNRVEPKKSNFAWWLGPQHMATAPSRFVILGDSGVMVSGRYSTEYINETPTRHGWWHGIQTGNLAFFDGSVRRTAMGDVTTKDYSFYMDETRHVGLDMWNEPSFRLIRRQ